MANQEKILGGISSINKTDTNFEIFYTTGEKAKINILNNHVFKYYMSPNGHFIDYPVPHNPDDVAKIIYKEIDDYDNIAFKDASLNKDRTSYTIATSKIEIIFNILTGIIKVFDKRLKTNVLQETEPLSYLDSKSSQKLKQHKHEYFFGGGMQNGRFTHKGQRIDIVNTNNWVDGGVTSPCPFYWSTNGYGILRNTWQPGIYDFGSKSTKTITTIHKGEEFDAYFFINITPKAILRDYYELTGNPILMPEYAFYEAHLNAFNRDYWVKVEPHVAGSILYEDGYYYKCYQPKDLHDLTGILESLNGEKNNYQFSARAMIDRYKMHDMPLGWFVPNDGYGSGYGQTDSLDGDIQNLKDFAEYSRMQGVEVALWTESNLHPVDPDNPKKGERDLSKEVSIAGVVALKCDVAWIGEGYSYGLNAVESSTKIFVKETKNDTRPMIITVDGWAGTQRHAGIWSGDQSGGHWEYIRFHIPTYIGASLSGQPIVGSDMDGIYDGKDKEVNIRDYQWKTFTPLQLNMDGWGKIPKTPFSFDKEATEINRAYLKLKSMLMPYNYTIAHESTEGLPMIRAMFLNYPKESFGYTKDSLYQYMWGDDILVAPVYKVEVDSHGQYVRNKIYLPDKNQIWTDLFTGQKYKGGIFLNQFQVPLWKIPVFVKAGAVIPITNPNNNPYEIKRDNRTILIYPHNESKFEIYEDDGISSDYLKGFFAKTEIKVYSPKISSIADLHIYINKTIGTYKKQEINKSTILQIITSKAPKAIKAAVNGKAISLSLCETEKEFEQTQNAYFTKQDFVLNNYLGDIAGKEIHQTVLLIKIEKLNVMETSLDIKIKDYVNNSNIIGQTGTLNDSIMTPTNFLINNVTATEINLKWTPVANAIYYEIERDGAIFTNISDSNFAFEDFDYASEHKFKIRAVSADGFSNWSDILTARTSSDPYECVVKDVKVVCNLPCQPCQEICKLTDGDSNSLWHSNWGKAGKLEPEIGNFMEITFDLNNIIKIEKIEYIPREDAGNGTIIESQYKTSTDGEQWSQWSPKVIWGRDPTAKCINIKQPFRYFKWKVTNSIGNFGSGKHVRFYKKD